jgi:hypothetical protein
MALSNIAAAHVGDAMDSTIAPHNPNSLEDKVFHADFVVTGIDDKKLAPRRDETRVPLVEQPNPSPQDVAYEDRADEMRTWWNNGMKKHLNQPDGYAKVAVLLIKWDDQLDDMKTKAEVCVLWAHKRTIANSMQAVELEGLFRTQFHYVTKTVELNVKKPQTQLENHIGEFIVQHDGPHNLLIVYYTGHGSYHIDKKCLELSASSHPRSATGFRGAAKANWNKAEEKLRGEEVEGDVLTILDTCYASNLVTKSGREEMKKFELLAACAIDKTTASPGEYSFTRALIDGLTELLSTHKEPISTFRLVQNINMSKRRSDTPAHVWARNSHNDQHVFLTPLTLDPTQRSNLRPAPEGYLTLRLGLKDPELSQEQIDYMTKTLSNVLNKPLIGIKKIEWLGITPAPTHIVRVARALNVAKQWRKTVKAKKAARANQTDSQTTMGGNTSSINAQKRKHESADESPNAKRQNSDLAQPTQPLSPVSNSSHIES